MSEYIEGIRTIAFILGAIIAVGMIAYAHLYIKINDLRNEIIEPCEKCGKR